VRSSKYFSDQTDGNLKEVFGYVLRELRDKKNVSQQSVADHCDFERVYISRLERGLIQPSLKTVFKLSEFFEMAPADFVRLVDELLKRRNQSEKYKKGRRADRLP
jgi:transcriptional regulator with XRE-family HTH domain